MENIPSLSVPICRNRLVAADDVAGHLLTDLPQWRPADTAGERDDEALISPMLLIDTAGCGLEELQVRCCERADVFEFVE